MSAREVNLRPRSREAVVAYYDGMISEMTRRLAGLREDVDRLEQRLHIAEHLRCTARNEWKGPGSAPRGNRRTRT